MAQIIVKYVVMAGMIGFAGMFLVVGIRDFLSQRRLISQARPVSVHIVQSQVVKHVSADTDSRLLRSNSTTSYRPEVRFRYVVDGREYESEMLRPSIIGSSYASEEGAAQEIASYPAGRTVTGFYSPTDPGGAFLKLEAGAGATVFLILGTILPAVGWVAVKLV
jgi:hypothetical protein